MDAVFRWIEGSALSLWIGQSETVFAFPLILVLHTLGMGMLAAVSGAIDLRMLGIATALPLRKLGQFLPLFWTGLAMNVISGLLLLIAYPTKALTNPFFYLKLACVGLGVWITVVLRREVLNDPLDLWPVLQRHQRLAALSLVAWTMAIALGRLLEYTYTRLYVDFEGA